MSVPNKKHAAISPAEVPALCLNKGEIIGERNARELARCSTTAARRRLSFEIAQKIPALPLGIHEGVHGGIHGYEDSQVMSAALAAPLSADAIKQLSFAVGMEIAAEETESKILLQAIVLAYQAKPAALLQQLQEVNELNKSAKVLKELKNNIDDAPVPRLLHALINRALYLRASDIHLEPLAGHDMRVRYRVAGKLQRDSRVNITARAARQLVRRIKVLSHLDTTETRLPQDGAFNFNENGSSEESWQLRLRVSVLPQLYGEKVVLRLLRNYALEELKESNIDCPFLCLGLNKAQRDLFRAHLGADRGAILLSGPTGSGKSTLLYTALQQLNTEERNIITIEDPVETVLAGVNQSQVDHGSRDFSDMLRAVLRQDPDVLMIGEVRDRETARSALTAGITGTLVLSTVHAGSCFEVLSRLLYLDVPFELLSVSLRVIGSQRLLRRNCPHCLQYQSASTFLAGMFRLPAGTKVAQSSGCKRCDASGPARIGVFEFIAMHERLRRTLRHQGREKGSDGAVLEQFMKVAGELGYRPYAAAVRQALLAGLVSADEAMRSVGIDPDLL